MPVLPTFVIVVILAGILHVRGRDIRLILLAAAAAMYALRATHGEVAGKRWDLFGQYFYDFARGLTNPASVVPICTAMGFAHVCKHTRCDAHLVNLLVTPLRHVRPLLVPGGIAVAFLVNSAIVSQTSTVAVVGPVLVPLLLAGGVSRRTAGAMLLLGGSMGGELMNPAAVEVTAIKMQTAMDATQVVRRILPYNLIASGTALVVFWLLSLYWQKRDAACAAEVAEAPAHSESIAALMSASDEPLERINVMRALVPLVPILLLMFVKPSVTLPEMLRSSDASNIGEQASIAAAMLIGVTVAALVSLKNLDGLTAAFFEGAGFAFAYVIPVIVGATMFAEGVRMNGLIKDMSDALRGSPAMLAPATIAIAWLMAMVTGTAVGTAPLVINMMLPIAMGGGGTVGSAAAQAGTRTGALAAIAAQFGRTSSPVAPVVIMCAALSKERAAALVKRVLPPLLAGGVALLIAASIWR